MINISSSGPKNKANVRPNCNFPSQLQFWKISVYGPIKQIKYLLNYWFEGWKRKLLEFFHSCYFRVLSILVRK